MTTTDFRTALQFMIDIDPGMSVKRAVEYADRMMVMLDPSPAPVPMTDLDKVLADDGTPGPSVLPGISVLEHWAGGSKIQAIKRAREVTSLGLKDTKDLIESREFVDRATAVALGKGWSITPYRMI